MALVEKYITIGANYEALVKSFLLILKSREISYKSTDDSRTKKEISDKIFEIETELRSAYFSAFKYFSKSIKTNDSSKSGYLYRGLLNSDENIWESTWALDNLKPFALLFSIRDLEEYINIKSDNTFSGIIEKINTSNLLYFIRILKCNYLLNTISLFDIPNEIFKSNGSHILKCYEYDYYQFNMYINIVQLQERKPYIYHILSKIIVKFPNIREAIELRAFILNNELNNVVINSSFFHLFFKKQDRYKDKEINKENFEDFYFVEIGIKDYEFLISTNRENAKDYYYKKGFLNYILNRREQANSDYENSSKKMGEYEDYYNSIIYSHNEQTDHNRRENERNSYNECACGESPCQCNNY